jgi:hypothetical protein
MRNDGLRQEMPGLVIPIAAFSRRTKSVFVEMCSILAGTPTVSLGNVRAYRAYCTVELICQRSAPHVSRPDNAASILPAKIAKVEGKPIYLDLPERVTVYGLWHCGFPLAVIHAGTYLSHLPYLSARRITHYASLRAFFFSELSTGATRAMVWAWIFSCSLRMP